MVQWTVVAVHLQAESAGWVLFFLIDLFDEVFDVVGILEELLAKGHKPPAEVGEDDGINATYGGGKIEESLDLRCLHFGSNNWVSKKVTA